jgi:uncharacterized membrane protein YkvI
VTEQFALTLIAASVGFMSAVFFCIGGVFCSAKQITLQSTPFWDFNEHVARSLTAQRAQFIVGALLLVVAFLLQVAAALASATNPVNLPQWLGTWPCLVLAVLVSTGLVAGGLSALICKATMLKVLALSQQQQE